jgi:hypothetical protein
MELRMIIRDSRVFGPVFEVRRTLRCTLGSPEIVVEDEVTNEGDTATAHHWLYHCNFGYPLLDEGVRFVYRGRAEYWIVPPPPGQDIVQPLSAAAMNGLKRVPAAMPEHAGGGERGLIITPQPDRSGTCRVGIINERLGLAVEMVYPVAALPRLAHWQHYGPRRSYATALEPFHGSLLGRARDGHPDADSTLAPGESRTYSLRLKVLPTKAEWLRLQVCDGPLASHRTARAS